jgi:hypothetical protein
MPSLGHSLFTHTGFEGDSMAKQVVAKKVVIDLHDDGTYKTGVIQYQLRIDGALNASKFYTMGIDQWIDTDIVNGLLQVAKNNIELGENIPK